MACPSTWEEIAPRRPRLNEVNANLTCMLCRGYLVDATTIVECLHSFCRSCIIQHLNVKCYCPICEMMINVAKPNIKPDKALQDIVYKMVPGLFEQEMERRRTFYESRPEAAAQASPEQRGEDMERLIFSPDDKISLSLELIVGTEYETLSSCSSDSGTDSLTSTPTNCGRRYLECPAKVKISHLKKFLIHKYDIDTSRHNVNVLYKRVPLPDFYTLMDIAYIYTWKRNEPMRFFYSFVETVPLIHNFEIFKPSDTKQIESDTDAERKTNEKDEDVDLNNCETGPVAQITEKYNHDNGAQIEFNTFEKCMQNNEDSVLNNDIDLNFISKKDILMERSNSNVSPLKTSDVDENESDLEKSQFLESIQLTAKKSCSPQKPGDMNMDLKSPRESPQKSEKNKSTVSISPPQLDQMKPHNSSPQKCDIKSVKSNSPQKLNKISPNNNKLKMCLSPSSKKDKIINTKQTTVQSTSPPKLGQLISDTKINTFPTVIDSKTDTFSIFPNSNANIGKTHAGTKTNSFQIPSPQKSDKTKADPNVNLSSQQLLEKTGSKSPQKLETKSEKLKPNSSPSKIVKFNCETNSNILINSDRSNVMDNELKKSISPRKSDKIISQSNSNSTEVTTRDVVCDKTSNSQGNSENIINSQENIKKNYEVVLPPLLDPNTQAVNAELSKHEISHPVVKSGDTNMEIKLGIPCNQINKYNNTSSKQITKQVPQILQHSEPLKPVQPQIKSMAVKQCEGPVTKNGKRKTYTPKANTKRRKLNPDIVAFCKTKTLSTKSVESKLNKVLLNPANSAIMHMNLNSKNTNKPENTLTKPNFSEIFQTKSENTVNVCTTNKKIEKITENLKQNLSSVSQLAVALREDKKGLNLEFGTNTLKSLIDSGCFNLPSSLSISLTESKDPVSILNRNMSLNEMTLTEIKPENCKPADVTKKRSSPVNNYIEILKLPEVNPSTPDSSSNNALNKPDSESKGPGPVPNLKPIETKIPKTPGNTPQTFQQTFLQSLQQIDSARFAAKARAKTDEVPNPVKSQAKIQNRPALKTKRTKTDTALDLSSPSGLPKMPENGVQLTKLQRIQQSHNFPSQMALQIPSLFNRPRPSSLSSSSPSPSPPCEGNRIPEYTHAYKQTQNSSLHMSALTQQALLYQQLKINQLEIMASQSTFSTAAMVHLVKSLQAQNKTQSNQSSSKTGSQLGNVYPPKTKQ